MTLTGHYEIMKESYETVLSRPGILLFDTIFVKQCTC